MTQGQANKLIRECEDRIETIKRWRALEVKEDVLLSGAYDGELLNRLEKNYETKIFMFKRHLAGKYI